MTINITQEDINKGFDQSYIRLSQKTYIRPKDLDQVLFDRCRRCPVAVALAMARASNQKCSVETYRLHIGSKSYRCPEGASDWMYEFDKGFDVNPFNFELDITKMLEHTKK